MITGLYPGLTESDIAEALDNALRAAGMEPFFDIVLFGLSKAKVMVGFRCQANIAQMKTHLIPTGAPMVPKCWNQRHLSSLMSGMFYFPRYSTTLEAHTTIGHISMATRPIFAARSSRHSWKNRRRGEAVSSDGGEAQGQCFVGRELLNCLTRSQVWDVVFEAQTRSIDQMRENYTAASIDIAAREVINTAGYEGTFTHRVGHGIGIKGA